jgi:hypothetical protein
MFCERVRIILNGDKIQDVDYGLELILPRTGSMNGPCNSSCPRKADNILIS